MAIGARAGTDSAVVLGESLWAVGDSAPAPANTAITAPPAAADMAVDTTDGAADDAM